MKITIQKTAFIMAGMMALGLTFCSTTYGGATLVDYWPLDELPGASASSNVVAAGDSAFLVNADTNSAWINSGLATPLDQSTGAVMLDGVDDYVNLGVLGLNGSATVSLWINPNDFTGDVRLFTALTANSTYAGLVRFDTFGSGKIQEISNVPGTWPNSWQTLGTGDLPPVGQWTHLVFSYHNGIVILYVNGVEQGKIYGGFQFDVSQFGLGAKFNGGGLSFSGAIDDVSVWNGPLSTNSVAQLALGISPTNIVDVTPEPQPAKLVQYFPLDDGAGSSTAANSVAGGNIGALEGYDPATAWTNDHPSQLASSSGALVFDGVDDYVNLGNLNLFGSAAVSLWLKPTTNNADIRIYSQITGGTGNTTTPGLLGIVGSGVQVYNSAVVVRISPDGTLPTNQWTHVVVSYDNGFATAYINGVPKITTKAVFAFNLDPFGLGANFRLSFGRKFAGVIDDVSIWDNALSATSIQQLANGTSPLSITDSPEALPEISVSFSITNPPPAVLKQYFPLEESGDSINAPNLVAGGNAGLLANYTASVAPWVTSGLPNQLTNSTSALFLDGIGNYANLGNVGLSAGTISLWVKPSSIAAGGFIFAQASGSTTNQGGVSFLGSGGLGLRGAGGYLAPDGTFAVGQWTHLAIVYDGGGSVVAYANGTNVGNLAANFNFDELPLALGAPLSILNLPFGQHFSGHMDDVALWNGALTEAEIQSLAAGVSPGQLVSSVGLVQYFPLNGAGTNLTVSNTLPAGNTGELVNYNATTRSWETNDLPTAVSGSTRSLFLDGINDFLNVGNIAQAGSGTVSLWIKPTSLTGDQRLISHLTGATTQQGHVGYRPTGEVWAWAGNVYRYPGPAGTLTVNEWHHLLVTFGGGTTTLFIDGVQKGTEICGFQFNGVEMGIGAKWINLYGNSVSGFIDEVSIWDKAVSTGTVEQLAGGASANVVIDTPINLNITFPGFPGGYFNLESANNVNGPWTPVVLPRTLLDANFVVSVPMGKSQGAQFFRLAR